MLRLFSRWCHSGINENNVVPCDKIPPQRQPASMTDQTVPQAQSRTTAPTKLAPLPGDFTADMSLSRTVQHLWPYVWPVDRSGEAL